jgi:hypothetical protein
MHHDRVAVSTTRTGLKHADFGPIPNTARPPAHRLWRNRNRLRISTAAGMFPTILQITRGGIIGLGNKRFTRGALLNLHECPTGESCVRKCMVATFDRVLDGRGRCRWTRTDAIAISNSGIDRAAASRLRRRAGFRAARSASGGQICRNKHSFDQNRSPRLSRLVAGVP